MASNVDSNDVTDATMDAPTISKSTPVLLAPANDIVIPVVEVDISRRILGQRLRREREKEAKNSDLNLVQEKMKGKQKMIETLSSPKRKKFTHYGSSSNEIGKAAGYDISLSPNALLTSSRVSSNTLPSDYQIISGTGLSDGVPDKQTLPNDPVSIIFLQVFLNKVFNKVILLFSLIKILNIFENYLAVTN